MKIKCEDIPLLDFTAGIYEAYAVKDGEEGGLVYLVYCRKNDSDASAVIRHPKWLKQPPLEEPGMRLLWVRGEVVAENNAAAAYLLKEE